MFSKCRLLSCYSRAVQCRSWKSTLKKQKKNLATDKALEHFDDFYNPVFKNEWRSIRLGLLTDRKYVAALNNYSDLDLVRATLESQGAISIKRLFEVESSKISEKSFKKRQNKRPQDLKNTLTELTDKKVEEEHEMIYPEATTELNLMSDRYIDPSVGVTQLYEYMPATELKGSDDWVRESSHFTYYKTDSDLSVDIYNEDHLPFYEHLHLYTFEPGNTTSFPRPRKGKTGVSDYYLLDGGSILPVLALDIKPLDVVLDMCAAPGGKSYLALQTLHPRTVVCNDISISRASRIRNLVNEFFYDVDVKMKNGDIRITEQDARTIEDVGYYNKILVDVPCTTDRHSVTEEDNNIFKSPRLKERIRLPELQSDILAAALKLVSVGGTVVYSTCSLSPIQNDGVVHMALQKVTEETNCQISVIDMSQALEPTKAIFRYADIGLRYGHLVVPYIVNNFGPTYFCKLVKMR